jgi:hypothetical protein
MDSPSFEHQALESDLRTLAAEIGRNRETREGKNVEGVEVVKEAIRAFPATEHAPVNAVPTPGATNGAASGGPLPAYAKDAPAEVKLEIEYLLDLALHKGVGTAIAESHKSPYFVQDAFHDALAGKLYPELQKRGVVK